MEAARIELDVREDINSPPLIVAVHKKSERVVVDLNPELRRGGALARVEMVQWTGKDHKSWSGKLYYPLHYEAAKRFPLVIQGSPTAAIREFSLPGTELMTAAAAQPLAAHDVAVLVLDRPDGGFGADQISPREFEAIIAGYEGAIDHFVAVGLADPTKIGVSGFSRYGMRAAHFLTHSEYPIAAALLADNGDDSYLQYMVWGASVRTQYAQDIGALPTGQGLRLWLQNAPGFNAEKIHAPLRLERDSEGIASVLESWEIFSQLRTLNRPVEFYVIPDVEQGAHNLERPRQLLASQGAVVDWFDFWLQNRQDPDPAKLAQYQRWHKLRELQQGGAGR